MQASAGNEVKGSLPKLTESWMGKLGQNCEQRDTDYAQRTRRHGRCVVCLTISNPFRGIYFRICPTIPIHTNEHSGYVRVSRLIASQSARRQTLGARDSAGDTGRSVSFICHVPPLIARLVWRCMFPRRRTSSSTWKILHGFYANQFFQLPNTTPD